MSKLSLIDKNESSLSTWIDQIKLSMFLKVKTPAIFMILFVSFISLIPLMYKYYVPDSRKLGSKDIAMNKMGENKSLLL